jgi:hypothetical protein
VVARSPFDVRFTVCKRVTGLPGDEIVQPPAGKACFSRPSRWFTLGERTEGADLALCAGVATRARDAGEQNHRPTRVYVAAGKRWTVGLPVSSLHMH